MTWMKLGGLVLAAAVGCGAFGAHGLKKHLTPEALNWWSVAVDYHFLHGLGLLMVGTQTDRAPRPRALSLSGRLFVMGLLLFCGSLYVLALTGQRWLGMIPPVGGLCFLVGWICFAYAFRTVK